MLPFQRILSIKSAAAGPYVVIGPCHDCGTEQPLVNLPQPFQLAIAVCRRCRFSRTGVEDRRGLIHGEARLSSPLEEPTPVVIRGLLLPGPPVVVRPDRETLPEYTMSTVEEIFAPWTPADDPEHEVLDAPMALDMTDLESEALAAQLEQDIEGLDDELRSLLAEIDRRLEAKP